jgi:hypothetical protein
MAGTGVTSKFADGLVETPPAGVGDEAGLFGERLNAEASSVPGVVVGVGDGS